MASVSSLRRHGSIEPTGRGVRLPKYHPSVRGARTLFPSRVFDVDEVQRALKSGHQSRKIGAFVTKGARKGWPIFTLTLEERATCPSSCRHFSDCYGNNMQAAERLVGGAALEAMLDLELRELAIQHPRGFLIRLHVLGDFYSLDYVRFWREALTDHPALALFGFTAHRPDSEIGRAIALLAVDFGWDRAAVRFSGAPHEKRAARVIESGGVAADAVLCPAQTGASACCATCALCWHSDRSIAFRRH